MRKFTEMYIKMQPMLMNKKGATMVEYALMLALIAIVCIIAVTAIGTNANTIFEAIRDGLATAAP